MGDFSGRLSREETAHWAVLKRTEAAMPVLFDGRLGWTTDTQKLIIGSQVGNIIIGGVGTTGDVSGPASSVHNHVAAFNGTTGKLIKDTGMPMTDISDAAAHVSITSGNPHGITPAMIGASDTSHTHSHTALTDIGVYTHVQLDGHVTNFANPHSVNKNQVGLGSVANAAQLYRTANDFISFTPRSPVGGDVILFEDAGTAGTKAWCNISQLPVSTATQTALNAKQDTLSAGTNIDSTDFSSDIVSVVDSPSFAGDVDALTFSATNTDETAAIDLYLAQHNLSISGVWTATGLNGFVGGAALTLASSSLALGAVHGFDYDLSVIDNGTSASSSLKTMAFNAVIDTSGVKRTTPANEKPFYLLVTGTNTGQDDSAGIMHVRLESAATSGVQACVYSEAIVSGTANGIGYKGYAAGVSGASGELVGVQGYGYDLSGNTHSAIVGLEAVISGLGGTPKDKRMGLRSTGHALLKQSSLFATSSSVATPNALSPTHIDPLNNTGEGYFEESLEVDGETFMDGNTSFSLSTETSASVNAGANTFLMCDATSNNITVNLPAASGVTGRVYVIKKIDSGSNTVTVDGNGSEALDGATTQVLSSQYDVIRIICDGSNWNLF